MVATEASENLTRELQLDRESLYVEETITDMRAGQIRRLIPIGVDGEPDSSRETLYVGTAQVMSAAGPLPLQFPIEAVTLEEALDAFPAAAEEAVRRMVEELKEMQRQQASQIVVPGAVPPGGPVPGGGKFTLR